MDKKNSASERIGGPGASHENAKHPEKSAQRAPRDENPMHSHVSGGGGERDSHHTHDPELKGDRGRR